MYLIPSLGFWPESLEAIVTGTVNAISLAHRRMAPGVVKLGMGQLKQSSINRSPTSYARNPASERTRYNSNVDEDMVVLRVENANGRELGSVFCARPGHLGIILRKT